MGILSLHFPVMLRDDERKFAQDYYSKSVEHRDQHKCGGYPYADGDLLNQIVRLTQTRSVLEIGTAIGYSAYCFAYCNNVSVVTIDMVEQHREIAENNWRDLDVANQIEMITGNSQDVLPTLNQNFDIVFFDGFAPNPNEVNQYCRLVGESGLLITTNHSWNKSTPEFIQEIENNDLNCVLKADTAFSSRDQNKVEMCVELWEKKHETLSESKYI